MRKIKELKYMDLCPKKDVSKLKFKTTEDIGIYNGIIGQERALDTVTTAMQISQKGFNLYVCGQVGMGKRPYVLSIVNKLSKKIGVPDDLCYIYNFNNPNEPSAVFFKAGEGRVFKEDIDRFINTIKEEIKKMIQNNSLDLQKKAIEKNYEEEKNGIIKKFDEYTSSKGFKIRMAQDGIYFSPIYKGEVLDEKKFAELDEKIKQEFKEKTPHIQEETKKIMKKLEIMDSECKKKISICDNNIISYIISKSINDLKIKYKGNLTIQNFLYNIQTDIITNIDSFKISEKDMNNMPAHMRIDKKPWEKYKVNLLVNNEKLTNAPVVVCSNPNYFDLFGKLEYENKMGSLRTDHTMLKPGLFHKANGGYLLVNARDLITNMALWEAFKRVLRDEELTIDISKDMSNHNNIISIKPETIKINTQVILFGTEAIYQQLANLDTDFKKLFKMKADFDDFIDKNSNTIQRTIEYIAYVVKKEGLLPFSNEAVAEIIEYSSRRAGDKLKLTAAQVDVTDIIIQSSYNAKNNNKKIVKAEDVLISIESRKKMYAKYDDNIKKMIEDGAVLISTSGDAVGRINGLTIINTGDASFGKPVRITANTYMGANGIVNIEREVAMSGNSHSKGIYILSAYIGEKFAQDIPLCFNASLCFEQLYNGVDGDSASSTELYALLSSLSEVPIKQGLAVTGSVNQKGEIQPIGGVSEKVEGFYEVCKMQGLTGTQGVIIPFQNVKNLILSKEVLTSIKDGMFHIYPVKTVDEGIEILTGIKSGMYIKDKGFEKNSINYFVYEKLKNYAKKSKEFSGK